MDSTLMLLNEDVWHLIVKKLDTSSLYFASISSHFFRDLIRRHLRALIHYEKQKKGDDVNYYQIILDGINVKSPIITCSLAHENRFEMLQWAYQNKYYFNNSTFISAASSRGTKMIKWLEKICSPTFKDYVNLITLACIFKNIPILEWVRVKKNNITLCNCTEIANAVALSGNMGVYFWYISAIRSNNIGYFFPKIVSHRLVIRQVMKLDNLSFIKQIYEHYSHHINPNFQKCLYDAAKYGKLETYLWFLELAHKYNPHILQPVHKLYMMPIKGGNIEVLEYMRSKGAVWDQGSYIRAAESGHIHVIRWLHKYGYPWDNQAINTAVIFLKIEDLDWMMENNCPVNWTFLENNASKRNCQDIMGWYQKWYRIRMR